MRITAVRIRNFRGIRSLDLELGPITVLIGENNTGKTSVLDALKLCLRELGPRRQAVFDALDHHLTDRDAEPSSTDPIEIELTFSDRADDEWDDGLPDVRHAFEGPGATRDDDGRQDPLGPTR